MLMFDQGKIVGQFKGVRELDALKKFIKQYVKEEPSSISTSPTIAAPSTPSPPPPPVNPAGEVLALDRDILSTTLSKGPAFVKFFAPWCGHCKKLAPVWRQLARHMQNKLTIAEVNCDDNSSVCKSYRIDGYPTLIYFDSNGVKSEYNGGRKIDQLKAFAEKAAAAYVFFKLQFFLFCRLSLNNVTRGVQTLDNPADLETLVAKEDVVYLLLHSPQDSEILVSRTIFSSLFGYLLIFFHSEFRERCVSITSWFARNLCLVVSRTSCPIFYSICLGLVNHRSQRP